MEQHYPNNAVAELFGNIWATTTTITVKWNRGALFWDDFPIEVTLEQDPDSPEGVREIVLFTNWVADTFTMVRAVAPCPLNNTTTVQQQDPQVFKDWATVEVRMTSSVWKNINELRDTKLDISTYEQEKIYKWSSTSWTDSYEVSIADATPLFDWQRFQIKCDVSNTWNATLNINSTWAKEIKIWEGGSLVQIPDNTITWWTFAFFTYLSGQDIFQYTGNEWNVVTPQVESLTAIYPAWETISAWNAVRLWDPWLWESSSSVYLTDPITAGYDKFIGFASTSWNTSEDIQVEIQWINSNQAWLTIWNKYYLSSTAGEISTSANWEVVWEALSATSILMRGKAIRDTTREIKPLYYRTAGANTTNQSWTSVVITHNLWKVPKVIRASWVWRQAYSFWRWVFWQNQWGIGTSSNTQPLTHSNLLRFASVTNFPWTETWCSVWTVDETTVTLNFDTEDASSNTVYYELEIEA